MTSRQTPEKRRPRRPGRGRRVVGLVLACVALLPVGYIAVYSIVPPPITPLMVTRLFEGEGLEKRWTPLREISPHVPQAVIAAEDNLFCDHFGFDWQALDKAIDAYQDGRRRGGASTISMQTAKNLLLWQGRTVLRKAIEAYVTLWLELLWSKRRIMEVYLNIAEWGPGIYGVGAAAETYFGKPAARLTRREASLLAAVLPNPRRWSPARPNGYIAGRARVYRTRVQQLGPMLDCVASG